jgi:hypothetical protein
LVTEEEAERLLGKKPTPLIARPVVPIASDGLIEDEMIEIEDETKTQPICDAGVTLKPRSGDRARGRPQPRVCGLQRRARSATHLFLLDHAVRRPGPGYSCYGCGYSWVEHWSSNDFPCSRVATANRDGFEPVVPDQYFG